MAIPSSQSSSASPVAADVPVASAMLGMVGTEILQRIDKAREEGRADKLRLDVKAEFREIRALLHEVKVGIRGMQAQMSRIELLLEEQSACTRSILDGIAAVLQPSAGSIRSKSG